MIDKTSLVFLLNSCKINVNIHMFVCEITPEIAKQLLEGCEFNRTLKPKQVNDIASYMVRNEWELNGEAIVFTKSGKLVNGNHRLNACIKSGASFKTCVIVGIDDEQSNIYDIHAKRRMADICSFYFKEHKKEYSRVSISYWNCCYAISKVQNRQTVLSEIHTIPNDTLGFVEAIEFVEKHKDAIEFILSNDYNSVKSNGLKKASLYPAVMAAFESGYDQTKLARWMEVIQNGCSLSKTEHQIITLREKLKSISSGTHAVRMRVFKMAMYSLKAFAEDNEKAVCKEATRMYYKIDE